MKPKIPQQIFKNESAATPAHDDMLLIFNKDSKKLKDIVEPYYTNLINAHKKRIANETDEIYLDEKNTAYKKEDIIKIGNDYFETYHYLSDDEIKHLIQQNEFDVRKSDDSFETTKLTKKQYIKLLIERERIRPRKIIECRKCTPEIESTYKLSWFPEYTIKNNSYYIGSVDLFVTLRVSYTKVLKIEKNRIWNNYYNSGIYNQEFNFLFEFKPQIKSFSETIRQVKVYESYFKEIHSNVITYSDISRFKDVFKSQGIELIQLKKEDDTQTNLG